MSAFAELGIVREPVPEISFFLKKIEDKAEMLCSGKFVNDGA